MPCADFIETFAAELWCPYIVVYTHTDPIEPIAAEVCFLCVRFSLHFVVALLSFYLVADRCHSRRFGPCTLRGLPQSFTGGTVFHPIALRLVGPTGCSCCT